MIPHPDPECEAALEWAADLGQRIHLMTRDELRLAWNCQRGHEHRAALKRESPGLLSILVGVIKWRLEQLPEAA